MGIINSGLNNISLSTNWNDIVTPPVPLLSPLKFHLAPTGTTLRLLLLKFNNNIEPNTLKSGNQILASGLNIATDYFSDLMTNLLGLDDSELGRGLGTLFSLGSSAALGTLSSNLLKGLHLINGLGLNVGTSLAGAGTGIAANYAGRGLTSLLGNNYTGRAVGAGFSTAAGTIGGALLSGTKALSSINPYALAGNVIGSALSAGNGPSKEYSGKYGNITKTMDSIYDIAMANANFIPGGQVISGAMALNKGLSNIFGSTDGMTQTDAILGSAFMPAPVKWLNMAGASKTGTFNNQSWQNTEKANSFMGNAFGNLSDRFDTARTEAGKTYGTFSKNARNRAQENIDFSNYAWNKVLAMSDLNELLNIRSLYMSSINNLRYAQEIGGAWLPIYRGKQGMKILNNTTNHNIGLRLLSGAALIDNKQMILSAQGGTKFDYSEEKLDDWFPDYKNTASTFGNMMKNLSAYFLKHKPDYEVSKYKPATSSNPNAIYYTIPNLKYDVIRNLSREYLTGKPLTTFEEVYNDNKFGNLREMSAVNLGRYKVSVGLDQNGRYISFYDKYDWNILESLGLGGQPFEIYDRIYEKEWPILYNNSK